jgi:LmbE family N-acetylglucosaminyl deacetylase
VAPLHPRADVDAASRLMRRLAPDADGPLERILAIGAHADDIEIGCGATLLSLTRRHPGLHVTWLVLAATDERAEEARASAAAFLVAAETVDLRIHALRDGFFPYGPEAKEIFEELKLRVDPQLVLTHARDDLHQDHRVACELTWNTFRDHVILEYEVPKFDGDLGRPNVYAELSEEVAREKVELLQCHFASQSGKHWFAAETFLSLMRLRGMEARSPGRYAEAFFGRKLVLDVGGST